MLTKLPVWLGIALMTLAIVLWFSLRPAPAQPVRLAAAQVVDLTQPLTPSIPIWADDPPVEIQPWAAYDKDGYFINRIAIGEHSGTHWGTPNTFIEGGRSADQVAAAELVLPAVVIDVRSAAERNPDYRLSLADIQTWERSHGRIPAKSLVILFTGWQDRWSNAEGFFNKDAEGVYHFPGFGAEAAAFLGRDRQVAALGTDTHGADPGNDDTYAASTAIYEANGLILECLAGLDRLPPIGATVIIGGLPIQGGSGSPARVLAIVP
ncbi:cyclase family protein [Phormidium tenue FACHB-886]|nr:cyclase family protein [Phormidium tenue FACHB-886]